MNTQLTNKNLIIFTKNTLLVSVFDVIIKAVEIQLYKLLFFTTFKFIKYCKGGNFVPTFTFKGGVHPPPQMKEQSRDKSIQKLPLPDIVYLFMSNHLGVPAKPVVKEGDFVKTGQLVGEGAKGISANIHSSVTGEVMGGIESIVNASTGRRDQAVVVKRTSEDQWEYVKHDADFKKNLLKKK